MTVLVTGATGNVGRNVVDLLLAAGVPVRATSRNPASLPAGVDAHAADLTEPKTFEAALDGVDKVFLFPSPQGVHGVVTAAKAAGVRHIVLLSSIAVQQADSSHPIARMHITVENAVADSGIAWTFVRPGAFATNTLRWAPAVKDNGGVRLPYAQGHISPIHEGDIAAVAATALLNDGHEGEAYALSGPESITQARQVELIGQAIGRPLWVEDLTGDDARVELATWFGAFGTPELIDGMLGLFKSQVGRPAEVLDTVERVTGTPARTFAQWAVDHKADFA
jgi:uncharacterized protein YbjT (DUF2867 family)